MYIYMYMYIYIYIYIFIISYGETILVVKSSIVPWEGESDNQSVIIREGDNHQTSPETPECPIGGNKPRLPKYTFWSIQKLK